MEAAVVLTLGTPARYHAPIAGTRRGADRGREREHVRDRDRFWRLILISGLVLCAVGVVAPIVGVQTIPTHDPFFTSADYWQEIVSVGIFTLICLGHGLTAVVMAVHGRGRHRRRLAALRGDVSAMPLAATRADPALAPDVAKQPLELMYRSASMIRYVYAPLIGIMALVLLISAGVAVVVLGCVLKGCDKQGG
jgi:hypothetical protein